jgi:hypothetical protein
MPENIRLTALSKEALVRLLKNAGSSTVSAETLEADIEAGAPVNPDGTVSLVEYAAWLCKEEAIHDEP